MQGRRSVGAVAAAQTQTRLVTPVAKRSRRDKALRYLAHVRRDGEMFALHDLDEHLRGVGQRAEEYARVFGSGDWAQVAGLWHDLGKYSAEFQQRIKSVSGYDTEADHVVVDRDRVAPDLRVGRGLKPSCLAHSSVAKRIQSQGRQAPSYRRP